MVFYGRHCYTPEQFYVYAVPEIIASFVASGSTIDSFGAITVEGSFQYLPFTASRSVYNAGDASTAETVSTFRYYLGSSTCPVGVPEFDADKFYNSEFGISPALISAGFLGLLSLWGIGIGIGLIIAALRKLRNT